MFYPVRSFSKNLNEFNHFGDVLLNSFKDPFFMLNAYYENHSFDNNIITIELPGVKKENIEVTIENEKQIKVSWERIKNNKHTKYFFSQEIIESAEAKLEDGILQIQLVPKKKSIIKIQIK